MILAAGLASLVFLLSLWLIFSERLNRSIAAIAGAVVMVGIGRLLGFYSESQAVGAIDFNTLGLLLGMMLLVALLEPSGVFQYLAVWASRLSRGQPTRLLVLLGGITAGLSMLLNNVTTAALVAPVTILICEVLGINPVSYLVTEAVLSNVGGAATLIGDPPNMLVASAARITFGAFLTHALPVAVLVWLGSVLLLRFLFRRELSVQPANAEALLKLDAAEAIADRPTATKVLSVLGAAVLFFSISHILQVSLAFVSVAAAAVALVWVHPNFDDVVRRVDWGVLVFFTALFVMVGGLQASGALTQFAEMIEGVGVIPPVVLGVLVLWVAAGLSAVIDNVPITLALIPVIRGLGGAGLGVEPLWWALVFGAGFGGNGTIIGASANIVIANLSKKTHSPITTRMWFRRGLPVMVVSCAVTSLLYAVMFPWFKH